MQILLNPSAIARLLGAMACLLVLASTGGQFAKFVLGYDDFKGLISLLHLDQEGNIPTFFSTFLLLFSALLLTIITSHKLKERDPYVQKWAILSFGFLIMACDESVRLHERMISPVRMLLGDNRLGIFYFAWVIPGIALVLFLGLFYLRFLLQLPTKTRLHFLVAATLYIGGAIGIELIGGRYAESHGVQNFPYSIIATIEESLEMAGLVVFIWALLKYCNESLKEVRVMFGGDKRI